MEFLGFIIDTEILETFIRLLTAAVLGASLGIERVFAHKVAGIRTYALVSMGSALFIIISTIVTVQFVNITAFDPLRMAASVITGIGFLCAGIIIFRNSHIEGLTTAAGLWVASGIGVASGFGLYAIAAFTTFVTIFIFTAVWFLEEKIKKLSSNWNESSFKQDTDSDLNQI